MSYDYKVDLWALACTLFELYSSRILFPGDSNSHMLWLMMQLKGRFPKKMVRKASLGSKYFNVGDDFAFLKQEKGIDGEIFIKHVVCSSPTMELANLISFECSGQDKLLHEFFLEFTSICLTLDPSKRLNASSCKSHSFFSKNALK
jgi:serine/threonine-protein kinase PRP4